MSNEILREAPGLNEPTIGSMLESRYVKALLVVVMLISYWMVASVKPPFSSPDEPNHLARAQALANGDLVLRDVQPAGNSGGEISEGLNNSIREFGKMLPSHDKEKTAEFISILKQTETGGARLDHVMANVAFYLPVVYLPQAIGLKVGELLGLSFYDSYQLANFATFAVVILIILMAAKIYPIPAPALLMLILPTSLFQIMSPTIDGMSFAIAVFAMSNFMRLRYQHDDRKNLFIFLLGLSIVVVAGSRANLLPMVVLPAWLYLKDKKKEYLICFALITVITLAWTAFNLVNVHDSLTARHPGYSNSELVVYYIKHPVEMAGIIYATITDFVYFHMFYTSMIGVLAWLDAPILDIFMDVFCSAIFIYFAAHVYLSRKSMDTSDRVFLASISLITAALVFCAILAQWSPFPTDRVTGVQGRYFTIPFIILAYAFPCGGRKYGYTFAPLIVLFGISVIAINFALDARFFM